MLYQLRQPGALFLKFLIVKQFFVAGADPQKTPNFRQNGILFSSVDFFEGGVHVYGRLV